METKRFIEDFKRIDVNKNWERFQNTVNQQKRDNTPILKTRTKTSFFTRVAAAVILLILAATTVYIINNKINNKLSLISETIEKTEIILPDGSSVTLNKGSELVYPEKFNKRERLVKLSGEAYFEITKDFFKPFYIQLKNSTVKVLGTSFNLKEDKNEQIILSIIDGQVSFYETNNKKNHINLSAGEQGVFNRKNKEFSKDNFFNKNFLFWKKGKLIFDNMQIINVFENLEKSFYKKIIVRDMDIKEYKLTTIFEGQTLEGILKELAILYDISYEIKGDTVFIQKDKN